MKLRFANDRDGPGVAALIDRVLEEYGDKACLEPGGSEADVLQIQSAYFDNGGAFWVLESDVDLVGSNAIKLSKEDNQIAELKRMYLAKKVRGTGAATMLLQVAIEWAKSNEIRTIELWSDSRFERGHRFYEKHGFKRTVHVREMTDSHDVYTEFHFTREL